MSHHYKLEQRAIESRTKQKLKKLQFQISSSRNRENTWPSLERLIEKLTRENPFNKQQGQNLLIVVIKELEQLNKQLTPEQLETVDMVITNQELAEKNDKTVRYLIYVLLLLSLLTSACTTTIGTPKPSDIPPQQTTAEVFSPEENTSPVSPRMTPTEPQATSTSQPTTLPPTATKPPEKEAEQLSPELNWLINEKRFILSANSVEEIKRVDNSVYYLVVDGDNSISEGTLLNVYIGENGEYRLTQYSVDGALENAFKGSFGSGGEDEDVVGEFYRYVDSIRTLINNGDGKIAVDDEGKVWMVATNESGEEVKIAYVDNEGVWKPVKQQVTYTNELPENVKSITFTYNEKTGTWVVEVEEVVMATPEIAQEEVTAIEGLELSYNSSEGLWQYLNSDGELVAHFTQDENGKKIVIDTSVLDFAKYPELLNIFKPMTQEELIIIEQKAINNGGFGFVLPVDINQIKKITTFTITANRSLGDFNGVGFEFYPNNQSITINAPTSGNMNFFTALVDPNLLIYNPEISIKNKETQFGLLMQAGDNSFNGASSKLSIGGTISIGDKLTNLNQFIEGKGVCLPNAGKACISSPNFKLALYASTLDEEGKFNAHDFNILNNLLTDNKSGKIITLNTN